MVESSFTGVVAWVRLWVVGGAPEFNSMFIGRGVCKVGWGSGCF